MDAKHLSSAHPGFSLIELLTVIAIVGVLTGILVPVAGVVRDSARRSISASNLHQIGVAIFMYCAEHDDQFPPPRANASASTSFASVFNWVGKGPLRSTAADVLTSDRRSVNKYLGPYSKGAEVLVAHAPMDESYPSNPEGGSLYDWTGSSYSFNYTGDHEDLTNADVNLSTTNSIKSAWIVRPSFFVIGMEHGAWELVLSGTETDELKWNGKNGFYHLLFGDGHVSLTQVQSQVREVDGSYTFTND